MEEVVVLEWTFSPADFFEEPIEACSGGLKMTIGNGKAEAKVPPDTYDSEPKMRDRLHEQLNRRFLGVQLLTHRPYELYGGATYRRYPDGRVAATAPLVRPAHAVARAVAADAVVRDKDGNIVSDSGQERRARKRQLADLAETSGSRNMLADSLLGTYRRAVEDPDNELVHLYEIRDALAKEFGGAEAARKKLGVSERDWKRLGELANNLPLRQGRHCGNSIGSLRGATNGELKEARRIARDLVESYMKQV